MLHDLFKSSMYMLVLLLYTCMHVLRASPLRSTIFHFQKDVFGTGERFFGGVKIARL
jgi:hypothetical protein